jgi:hypothetical protein
MDDVKQVIDRHLKRTYDRVRRRRIRAGLDPTPPPGWRDEARLVILLAIKARVDREPDN